MIAAVVSCESWGIRVSKSLGHGMEEAWNNWWYNCFDPGVYEAFVAGWQASKADSNNHKVVVEYDLAPALIEGAIMNKIVELGWIPPGGAA